MKIGFNTRCFANRSLEEVFDFAASHGFSSLEISCGPGGTGIHHLDADDVSPEMPKKIKELMEAKQVDISCLSYYANMFLPYNGDGEFHLKYLKKVIDLASLLGIELVSTFTGYRQDLKIEENLELLASTMKPVLAYAQTKNIRIMLENTPLIFGEEFGGNFAHSPEMWDLIFTRIPDANFGLNYDPSHLFWLGIDYMLGLNVFPERIFHIQAKDAEIKLERIRMTGILGNDWFGYRIPGSGSIDWRRLMSGLYEMGYDGFVSLELEDPVWLQSIDRIKKGLLLGKKFLDGFIV